MKSVTPLGLIVPFVCFLTACTAPVMAPAAARTAAELAAAPVEPGASSAPLPAAPRLTAPEPNGRLVVYNATLTLVVLDIAKTQAAIRETARTMGGYLGEIDGEKIVIRVPVSRFQDAYSAIEQLGEVTSRHIQALDVTEEIRDLGIRLENAEQMRKQLLALVEKSQKMEETLKIEAELMRLTEQVELLKGKLQYLAAHAAMSTIGVQLNSPLPQKQMVAQIPFAWVRELGNGLVAGTAAPDPDTSRWRARNVRFELPPGYIRYFERDQQTEAMSASGMLIKLQRQENYDGGRVEFWSRLVRRALSENRAIAVREERELTLESKAKAHLLVGSREIAGKPYGYLVALIATRQHVYSFEAWGPQEAFAADIPAMEKAIRSLDIHP